MAEKTIEQSGRGNTRNERIQWEMREEEWRGRIAYNEVCLTISYGNTLLTKIFFFKESQ